MKHIINDLYDSMGEEKSFFAYIKQSAHLLFCRECSYEARKLENAQALMGDFFPDMPCQSAFEDALMEQVYRLPDAEDTETPCVTELSMRRWVLIGVILLCSLLIGILGEDFGTLAHNLGRDFLMPVGITIGAILTGYGAIFIGSHLKELSERFGLKDV